MNLPHDKRAVERFQSVVICLRMTGMLARAQSVAAFVSLLRRVVADTGLGGIVLDEGRALVLALEGSDDCIEHSLDILRACRFIEASIAWRVSILAQRYRRGVLAQPELTASELAWLKLEIESGFGNLGALPTLLDWLAIRQADPHPTLRSESLVSRALDRTSRAPAKILQFRRKDA